MIVKDLNLIQKAMNDGLITPDESSIMIDNLKFYERQKYVLEWGKHYFPDKFTAPFCEPLHGYLSFKPENIEYYKNNNFKAATHAPRGSSKTTIECFLNPMFIGLNFPNLYYHYLNIQSVIGKALDVNISMKEEFETNELLIKDYGDMVSDEKWTERMFVLNNGVIYSALGAGQSVRGLQYRNKRPDYIIPDDLYGDEDINNIERIRKKENWFWGSIYKCVPKTKNWSIRVSGTAIHDVDIIHKLGKNKEWKYKKFQAIIDFEKKIVLWPEVESFEDLIKDREQMGSIIFEREMQNNCRDDATSIIKRAWIKWAPQIQLAEGEKIIRTLGSLDPAVGEKATNDYSAMCAGFETNYGNFFIDHVDQKHFGEFSLNKTVKKIERLHERYKFDIFKIETISGFKFVSQEVIRTTGIPVKSFTHVQDKITELENEQAKFENGKITFNSNLPDKIKDIITYQLINNKPSHDDIRDAIILLVKKGKTPTLIMGIR